jgi:uncharacterized protein (DUF1786 family)
MLEELYTFLSSISVDLPEKIFVAVQDHGFSPRMSNRKFRFEIIRRTVKRGSVYTFLYHEDEIPDYFNRMKSVVESIKDFGGRNGFKFDVYVIDTVFAALVGAMLDVEDYPAFIVNLGNSHTVGAVVDERGEILSLFEHHTFILRRRGKDWISSFFRNFLEGKVSDEDVFEDGGHGAYMKEVVEPKDFISIGPNSDLSPYRVAELPDTMIAGNLGMIKAFEMKT